MNLRHDAISRKYYVLILALLALDGWTIFMHSLTFHRYLENYWTYILYVIIALVLLVFGMYRSQILYYLLYTSLLIPIDSVFQGVRFLSFRTFYSHLYYIILSLSVAYFSSKLIKSKKLTEYRRSMKIAISLLLVIMCIAIGTYQHHLYISSLDTSLDEEFHME